MSFTLAQLLDAAMTVGYGTTPLWLRLPTGPWELLRRIATVQAYLDLGAAPLVGRSALFDASDATEKGFATYSIGMTMALLVARLRLGISDLAHYDAVTKTMHGRRPDLVSVPDKGTNVEAKGRTSAPTPAVIETALHQLTAQNNSGAHSFLACCSGFTSSGELIVRAQYWPPWGPCAGPVAPIPHAARSWPDLVSPWDLLCTYGPLVALIVSGGDVRTVSVRDWRYLARADAELGLTIGVEENLAGATWAALQSIEPSWLEPETLTFRGAPEQFPDSAPVHATERVLLAGELRMPIWPDGRDDE
jgi:hypothetical protein